MKPYEIITLVLCFVFGLLGAGLSIAWGDGGEYLALFIYLPPPVIYYLYGVWENKKPSPNGKGFPQRRSG